MTSIEFLQNVYKGVNLDRCEEHLKGFLKHKIYEANPEHFDSVKKYQEIANLHSSIFEDCKDCDEDDDEDSEIEDSDDEDEDEKDSEIDEDEDSEDEDEDSEDEDEDSEDEDEDSEDEED